MHARSDFARNCTAMPSLPLFSLLCSSENCQSLKNASLDTGGSHRLSRMTTGTRMWPSAQNEPIGWWLTAGRHKMLPVGKQYLQNLQLTAAEGKILHGNAIQAMYAPITFPIMLMTQGRMCLDSRATNHAFPCMMAQWIKCALSCQMKCNANNKPKNPNFYHTHFKRPSMHNAMQS